MPATQTSKDLAHIMLDWLLLGTMCRKEAYSELKSGGIWATFFLLFPACLRCLECLSSPGGEELPTKPWDTWFLRTELPHTLGQGLPSPARLLPCRGEEPGPCCWAMPRNSLQLLAPKAASSPHCVLVLRSWHLFGRSSLKHKETHISYSKKVESKKIKEHLTQQYKHTFSEGTGVFICFKMLFCTTV